MSTQKGVSARATVIVAIGMLLAGMALRSLIGGASTSSSLPGPRSVSDSADRAALPAAEGDGATAGFDRIEAGAVAVAVGLVTNGQALIDLAPTQLNEAVRRYATDETADGQIDDLAAELGSLRDVLANGQGRIRYLQAVLATRVEAFSVQRARVSVWSVGVLWRTGAADPQAGWTTTTFDLVWENQVWKVWAETTTSGPTPAPNGGAAPVDADELDRLLVGFDAWGTR
jgi:hypothetical protein